MSKNKEEMKIFDKYFENLPYPTFIIDRVGLFKQANQIALQKLGYNKDEIVGYSLQDVPFLTETSREKTFNRLKRRKEGEKIPPYELKFKKKEGGEYFAEVAVGVIGDDVFEGEIVVCRDVTEKKKTKRELKESEEKYRTLVETSFAGIVITDFDRNLLFVNDTFAEMLDYEKEKLEGKKIEDISLERPDILKKRAENRKKGKKSDYESKFIKKNGEVIDVIVNGSSFKDAEGEYIGTMAVITDITKRKKTQKRLQFLNTLLRHDMKNIFQNIQKDLEKLKDKSEENEKQKGFVKKIFQRTQGGIDLLEKINILIKAQEEKKRPVDIAKAIEDAVDSIEEKVRDKDVVMQCPSKGCLVEGGPLLREVFYNILENAAHHSGGDIIKISGEIRYKKIKCTVEDDGKGIHEDEKNLIFQKGYTTDKENSSGLGMFLVKILLDTYNGTIEVKDSDLGGTRFDIMLNKVH